MDLKYLVIVIPLSCWFISGYGYVEGTTPTVAEKKTKIVKFGDNLEYSWELPKFNKLTRMVLRVNKTTIAGSYKANFPNLVCNRESNICKRSIKPLSSISDGKFNLVIKNLPMVFNGSTMHAVLYYKWLPRVPTSVLYIIIVPKTPQTSTSAPHTDQSVTTTCPVCPTLTPCTTSGLSCPCSYAQLQELQEDVDFYKDWFIVMLFLFLLVSLPNIICLICRAKTCIKSVKKFVTKALHSRHQN